MPFPPQPPKIFSIESILDIAPGTVGIYGIYSTLRWIYIGQALDLQRRLLEHYNGTSQEAVCIWAHKPSHFLIMIVDITELNENENELIYELWPDCNR